MMIVTILRHIRKKSLLHSGYIIKWAEIYIC